ncbi:MAG: transposase [Nostoc sp. JL33]|nr:transposase [Nostoc sp. JL33]
MWQITKQRSLDIEIGRFFPSPKTCSCCRHIIDTSPLDIREWDCPSCDTDHDRNGNASQNIRTEGIRILSLDGGKESSCRVEAK